MQSRVFCDLTFKSDNFKIRKLARCLCTSELERLYMQPSSISRSPTVTPCKLVFTMEACLLENRSMDTPWGTGWSVAACFGRW